MEFFSVPIKVVPKVLPKMCLGQSDFDSDSNTFANLNIS